MSDALLIRREGAVLVLSNNNPAARNALSPAFYAAVTTALADAAADASVGAVVLTGEGGHFCAGGDLRQLARRRELPVEQRREKLEGLHDLIRAVRDCPKPVIAASKARQRARACRWPWPATCASPPTTPSSPPRSRRSACPATSAAATS